MASLPFHVKAVYEYHSEHDDDLSFPIGQIIAVTEIEDDDWYVGEYTDSVGGKHDGLFPKNYVERYEPPAPPRPTRPRPKKDAAPAAEPDPVAHVESPLEPASASVEEPVVATSQPEVERPQPVAPAAVKAEALAAPKPAPAKPVPTAASSDTAPDPAPKPSSFRDRIAAFNKPAAPPIAPKPSGVGASGGFIKKPFVPPPPSRDAYVPPPREAVAPQKVYRREEDPEIAERQAQAQRDAEDAGLAGGDQEEEGEAPKATSLKDRIAMLRKQQEEQAARRAENAPKEKPKVPTKPRTDAADRDAEDEEDGSDLSKMPSPEPALDSPPVAIPKQPSARRPSHHSLEPSAREIPSDGNDADQSGAGDTTEDADASSTEVEQIDDRSRVGRPGPPAIPSRTSTSGTRDPVAKEIEHEEQLEEEDEIDDETRRKEELRARMAKMSGGMGMAGFFGGPMPSAPPAKKSSASSEKRAPSSEARSPPPSTPRAPMVPVPGMGLPPRVQSPESESVPGGPQEDEDDAPHASRAAGAPPVPQERPLPPPPQSRAAPPVPVTDRPVPAPAEGRSAPPPPLPAPVSYDAEGDSDEPTPLADEGSRPVPAVSNINTNVPAGSLPQSPPSASKRASQIAQSAAGGPMSPTEKRMSRPPPPIPGTAPQSATSSTFPGSRPPPPPPPGGVPPSRSSTVRETSRPGDGESDYEGDYDTDIASAVPHKDALKAHERGPSIDEGTLSEDTSSTGVRPAVPPPAPPSQRSAPPPPPHQPPGRTSGDTPRAPPPAPPHRSVTGDEEDYDPYRYEGGRAPTSKKGRVPTDVIQESDPSLYAVPSQDASRRAPPPAAPAAQPPQRHSVPPPMPPEHTAPPLPTSEQKQSMETSRRSLDRRSIDPGSRPSDGSMIARDVDLAESTQWWTGANMPPPVFQDRPDVLYEMEETTTSKRGGRTIISRDVYILFQDYSQTVVTARFDPREPSNNVHLEQRHESPPARMRQDQLEAAHAQYGQALANAAAQKQNGTVGDGSPQALILELLNTAAPNALKPIGTRAYGSLVYANMANASVQQLDEIRPGDVVSFRNARFQGKHGAMHAKYSLDVGRPEHVAVVMEWDGTKKKIRAWEQGREKERKVKVESFKMGDLRSGEVKVWRLVGRDFVGWDANA